MDFSERELESFSFWMFKLKMPTTSQNIQKKTKLQQNIFKNPVSKNINHGTLNILLMLKF